jgi:hypothetical protein
MVLGLLFILANGEQFRHLRISGTLKQQIASPDGAFFAKLYRNGSPQDKWPTYSLYSTEPRTNIRRLVADMRHENPDATLHLTWASSSDLKVQATDMEVWRASNVLAFPDRSEPIHITYDLKPSSK